MASSADSPYVPGCDIVEQDRGCFPVTHLDSGRVLPDQAPRPMSSGGLLNLVMAYVDGGDAA
ncbi:hypothetical protein [Nonomuraea sp. NPDC049028]|uniref:hypothetical protein n=1 Tax=Nonomuraea sp. NPDC049028 TaxID=3364348 RepID=UPI003714E6BB